MQIQVGKFSRTVEVEIFDSVRCTRWDVYPQRQTETFLSVNVLGTNYQREPGTGLWFRSVAGTVHVRRATEEEIPDNSRAQLEALVNA